MKQKVVANPSFSMKPADIENKGTGSSESSEEWTAWHDYVYASIDAKEVEIESGKFKKTKTYAGYVNLIVEAGFIPAEEDAQYDTQVTAPAVGVDEYTPEEQEVVDKYPSNYFKWVDGKRKQCRPQNPEEELVICIDLPKVMLDYSKHPASNSDVPDIKPLRISLNGTFKRAGRLTFARNIALRLDRDKKISNKNMLYKIAECSGVLQQFIDSEYDLGVIAGVCCNWSLEYIKNVGDRTFHNIVLKTPITIEEIDAGGTIITVEQQIPECPVPFVGIRLNGGDYSEDVLRNLRKEFLVVMERGIEFHPYKDKYPDWTKGCNWKDTDLCKALEARNANSGEQGSSKKKEVKEEKVVEIKGDLIVHDDHLMEDDGFDEEQIPF